MTGFLIGSFLLVLATLSIILWPLMRHGGRTASADFSRQQLNAAIYRDQFVELERDRAQGVLSQADYDQARAELQRRLLEDSNDTAVTAAPAKASRGFLAVIALVLPVGAILFYLFVGNPGALNAPAAGKQFSSDDIERMVSGLAAKLEKEPDNLQGWVMLARSYKAMGRLPEAVRAYERTGSLLEENADLLVDYADLLAASSGGFTPKVKGMIDKALNLDPANAQGLWLRGTVAFEEMRYGAALDDWQRLLALLPPGSDDARVVQANIAEAQAKGGVMGKAVQPRQQPQPERTGAAQAFVKGRVEVAKSVADKLSGTDALMVIARPADGTRMPVAVIRAKASELPLSFTLDDSLAMSPDHKLSKYSEVMVEARISKTGQAMAQPGDLISSPQTVKLGRKDVRLLVDQVRN